MRTDVWDFLTRLSKTGASKAAWKETKAFMRGLGASHLVYGFGDQPDNFHFETTLHEGKDRWWMERYEEEGYAAFDYSLHHALHHVTPIEMGVDYLPEHPNLHTASAQVVHEIVDTGFRSAVTFPLRGTTAHARGGFTFATELAKPEFQKLLLKHGLVIALAAQHFHAHMQTLLTSESATPDTQKLTARQTLVLNWIMEGLTPQEVADKLGLSYETVKFHLRGARERLGTTTVAHTVATALKRGFLDFG